MPMSLGETTEAAALEVLGIDPAALHLPGCGVEDMARAMQACLLSVGEANLEDIDQNNHANEVWCSLDRLLFLMRTTAARMKSDQNPPDENFGKTLGSIKENLLTIATRLSMSHAIGTLIAKMVGDSAMYELGQNTAGDVLQSTIQVAVGIRQEIIKRQGKHQEYCPMSCSEEAMLKAKLTAIQANQALNPDRKLIYPGDIEYSDDNTDAVMAELVKMAPDSDYKKLLKLLYNVKLDALLMDPELRERFTDAEVSEAKRAVSRTMINLFIGVADAIPVGPGEGPSWVADTLKALKYLGAKMRTRAKWLSKIFPEWFDLTPDVSLQEAVYTEGYEFISFGFVPSHLIFEFRHQFQHDCPRLVKFLEKVAKAKAELADQGASTVRIATGEEEETIAELQALEEKLQVMDPALQDLLSQRGDTNNK